MFTIPTAPNFIKFFLSVSLAAFGTNALAQRLPNDPTKLPPISNDKTVGKADLTKDNDNGLVSDSAINDSQSLSRSYNINLRGQFCLLMAAVFGKYFCTPRVVDGFSKRKKSCKICFCLNRKVGFEQVCWQRKIDRALSASKTIVLRHFSSVGRAFDS